MNRNEYERRSVRVCVCVSCALLSRCDFDLQQKHIGLHFVMLNFIEFNFADVNTYAWIKYVRYFATYDS